MYIFRVKSSVSALALLIGTMALQGCQGTAIPGLTTPSYAIAADDPCRAERASLKAVEDYFTRSMIQGAAAGAVVGGAAGALLGSDRLKGALIGMTAGAVVGAAGGYFVAKQRQASSQDALVRGVYQDMAMENEQIDRTTAAFRAVRDCRFRTANGIKASYAAGRVEREAAQRQLAQVRTLFEQDVAYAESLGAAIDTRSNEYRNAADELVKSDPAAQQALATRRAEQSAAEAAARAPAPQAARPAPRARSQPTPPPAPAPAPVAAPAPPPADAAGVAQLAESNQIKRQALGEAVREARVAAADTFDLAQPISRVPPTGPLARDRAA